MEKAKKMFSVLIFVTASVGIILGIWQVKPPLVNKTSPYHPAYIRMMENIERFAAEPRNSGSVEIERVRAGILAEIEAMGLTPIIEDASYTPSEYGDLRMRLNGTTKDDWWSWAGDIIAEEYGIYSFESWFALGVEEAGADTLQNILVKLDAPNTERIIMFVSHYDSVHQSPGAADAMLPVCAMLEVMRVHSQNGELKTNIYFLFTDGEENNLLGARKFVDAYPELKGKIDMVINLEMRGNSGGLLLFETSPQSYRLMRSVLQSGAKPIGTSWAAALYAMMPNDTDLTVFLNAGYAGVNFAAIEGVEHYHMPTDNFENLNRNTAWQYLLTTFALADYAANNTLDELRKPSQDVVYFPFLPSVLILMPVWGSHIICAMACVLALVSVVLQARRKQLQASFTIILMGLLFILSIGSAIWFASGSYLFYIPLLAMTATAFLRKWSIVGIISRMLCGITVLLIWIPVVFLLWVSMIQSSVA